MTTTTTTSVSLDEVAIIRPTTTPAAALDTTRRTVEAPAQTFEMTSHTTARK